MELVAWEKVAVHLHVGEEAIVKKVWRFSKSEEDIISYTRLLVQQELIQLFPDINRKGLKLEMWYTDALVGDVR